MPKTTKKILVVSGAFPSNADPSRGIFVHQRARALSKLPDVEIRVIAPTPWAPPVASIPKWHAYNRLPKSEVFRELSIQRPRYFLPPKVGGYFHPQLMYPFLLRAARRLRQDFEFDLIDAHFVYATGVAATKLGLKLGIPVCLTGRGEDMMRFPSLPFKGSSIRWALENADAFIGVSQEISREMVRFGAKSDRVTTIANGVDVDQFCPKDRDECREKLNLPIGRRILLTVGDRLELKGFHIVIEALPEILKKHPDTLYVCVGGPGRHGRDYTEEIEALVDRHGLGGHVLLAGARPHDELVDWYNASDLYVLASSREGSPNALLEALSCGVPAVATRVGSAPDELEATGFGALMKERSPREAALALSEALERSWDRQAIRATMRNRSWNRTADAVFSHLSNWAS